MTKLSSAGVELTAGLDLGDRWLHVCVLDHSTGEVLERSRVRMTEAALRRRFSGDRMRLAMEVGSQSPWISRLLSDLGHGRWPWSMRVVGRETGWMRKLWRGWPAWIRVCCEQ